MTFVPHLVPAVRGVLATCYAKTAAPWTISTLRWHTPTPAGRSYAWSRRAASPTPSGSPPRTSARSGRARPAAGVVVAVGAVDNLVKGAAGQAVQNLNLMFGEPEAAGLPRPGGVPVSVTAPEGLSGRRDRRGIQGERPAGPRRPRIPDGPAIAAALFTTNAFPAAPVTLTKEHLASSGAWSPRWS